jgi:oligopeptide transport system substrate-binding protein
MQEESVRTAHFVTGVTCAALGERTLELRFEDPRPYVPYLLAQAPLFPWPRHRVESLGDSWREPAAFVGSGPFVIREIEDGKGMLLTANPLWNGPRGNVAQVAIGFRLPDNALDDWRSGRFEFLFTSRDLGLADAPKTLGRMVPLLGVAYVAFNDERAPLDDKRVRKALAHGLDRGPLLEGHEPARGGFLPPAMPGHSHDLVPPRDLERARTLLSEAGYPGGEGLPELWLVHADFGFGEKFRGDAEARWQSPWPGLGVRVHHEWVSSEAVPMALAEGAHLLEWGWVSDYPDPDGILGTFAESGQLTTRDPKLKRFIADARSARSKDERLRLYREADRRLVAEGVFAVPVYYDAWHLVHRPWLQGLWATPTQLGSLEQVVVRR